MQKKPISHSHRSITALMSVAATMPITITSSFAGEGGYHGMSGLAQREIIRRQGAVAEADRLFIEGREAFEKGDYQQAVDKFRSALSILPDAPTFSDRRASYTDHISRASVALAQDFRKVGKYDEARLLLEGVLSPEVDPNNFAAKAELGYLDDPIRTNPALTYEHTKNIDEVRRGLYMAEGNYDLGKYDAAKLDYESVLRIDPFNKAARRGMEKVAATKSDYYRAAYDQTRAELLMQVDKAWELSVPADLPVFDVVGGRTNLPTDGVAYITEKLSRIVIPKIDFEDTSVEEAIDFLRLRAAELDTAELDPDKKGVNFVIRRPKNSDVGAGLPGNETVEGAQPLLAPSDPGTLRIGTLRLRNVPLAVALRYICEATKLRYKVDDFAVTIVPQTETGEDLFTRTFRVPPDFANSLSSGGKAGATVDIDPFAPSVGGGTSAGGLVARPPIIELLKNSGVNFSEGSSATLGASGTLLITNTPSELDKIEQLIESQSVDQPKQVKITTKFVEITQENNEELGFDWIVSPFGDSKVFGIGGTVGNGARRVGSDFISPVDNNGISGINSADGQVTNIVTSGLRSGDQAVNRNSIDALLNNPGRTAQTVSVAPGILGLTGIFGETEMQVMMRGLSQKRGIDLMTAPSITAKSGQKATIEVIREFIYPTEYDPPELPQGGSGPLGGSAGGGGIATPANPTAFNTKNTGVTLEIEPTLGENDFVIDLRFLPEIVEFEGFINYGSPIQSAGETTLFDDLGNIIGFEPFVATITENRIEMPIFSKRSVNTTLTIYDGYTVAVGGLMREDVQNVEDKVPILGDIPLIGRLFQSKSENHIKSNLIIFVTAQIIDATGRPLRGADSAGAVPVSAVPASAIGGATDGLVLPPLEGLPN